MIDLIETSTGDTLDLDANIATEELKQVTLANVRDQTWHIECDCIRSIAQIPIQARLVIMCFNYLQERTDSEEVDGVVKFHYEPNLRRAAQHAP